MEEYDCFYETHEVLLAKWQLSFIAGLGISKNWTGFSTGMWDWNVGLDYRTGMWDWNVGLDYQTGMHGTGLVYGLLNQC